MRVALDDFNRISKESKSISLRGWKFQNALADIIANGRNAYELFQRGIVKSPRDFSAI